MAGSGRRIPWPVRSCPSSSQARARTFSTAFVKARQSRRDPARSSPLSLERAERCLKSMSAETLVAHPLRASRKRRSSRAPSPANTALIGRQAELSAGVDGSFVRRKNRPVGVEVVSEIARLRASIDRAAAATELTLIGRPWASEEHDSGSPLVERKELCRQLAALRERVAVAEQGNEDPGALRAELATLLFFAKTLQADADDWRSTLEGRIKEVEWERSGARRELERLAAEREMLARRRDALQARIVHTATRMAKRDGGESRRTLPVLTVGEGLTVCSVSVFCPRRRIRVGEALAGDAQRLPRRCGGQTRVGWRRPDLFMLSRTECADKAPHGFGSALYLTAPPARSPALGLPFRAWASGQDQHDQQSDRGQDQAEGQAHPLAISLAVRDP